LWEEKSKGLPPEFPKRGILKFLGKCFPGYCPNEEVKKESIQSGGRPVPP